MSYLRDLEYADCILCWKVKTSKKECSRYDSKLHLKLQNNFGIRSEVWDTQWESNPLAMIC